MTGASLGNSDRGVQDQIFRQKGVVMERFSDKGVAHVTIDDPG